jgi:hypothetical protein
LDLAFEPALLSQQQQGWGQEPGLVGPGRLPSILKGLFCLCRTDARQGQCDRKKQVRVGLLEQGNEDVGAGGIPAPTETLHEGYPNGTGGLNQRMVERLRGRRSGHVFEGMQRGMSHLRLQEQGRQQGHGVGVGYFP